MLDGQYYWFSENEISRLKEKLEDLSSSEEENMITAILTELKVSPVRSRTVGIDVLKLQNALGLETGSKPLWLTDDEHIFITSMLAQ